MKGKNHVCVCIRSFQIGEERQPRPASSFKVVADAPQVDGARREAWFRGARFGMVVTCELMSVLERVAGSVIDDRTVGVFHAPIEFTHHESHSSSLELGLGGIGDAKTTRLRVDPLGGARRRHKDYTSGFPNGEVDG